MEREPGPLTVDIVSTPAGPKRFEVVVRQDGIVLHAKAVDSWAEANRIRLLITAGARGPATPGSE